MSLVPLGLSGGPSAAGTRAVLNDPCLVVAWALGRDVDSLQSLF